MVWKGIVFDERQAMNAFPTAGVFKYLAALKTDR